MIKIFAPQYIQAKMIYEKMLTDSSAVGPTDLGFTQISSIISKYLSGGGDLTIDSIKIKAKAWTITGTASTQTITLEIKLRDGRSIV